MSKCISDNSITSVYLICHFPFLHSTLLVLPGYDKHMSAEETKAIVKNESSMQKYKMICWILLIELQKEIF